MKESARLYARSFALANCEAQIGGLPPSPSSADGTKLRLAARTE
jgi:hypothetical protein